MIATSDVLSSLRSLLDDDNSGRYTDADDLIPAINASIDFWVSVLNHGFEQKRIIHESLRDLVTVGHYTATSTGDIASVTLPDTVWTVFGVDLEAVEVSGEWVGQGKVADRLSISEWGHVDNNPFAAGTSQDVPDAFKRAGYIGIGSYTETGSKGILIRPASMLNEAKDVLIWYLNTPTKVTSSTDDIEFPRSMELAITHKALNYISYQHGPQSPYFQYTDRDVTLVAQLLNS